MAERRTTRRSSGRRRTAAQTASEIHAWEEDPGVPGDSRTPIKRPVPQLDKAPLPTRINGRTPSPKPYDTGTAGFRYWTAADALRRAGDLWGAVVPGLDWFQTVGPKLTVGLDEGQNFNAFYDRRGLQFFHGTVEGTLMYSGESPDVVCHEVGHAVLDALVPELWDAAADEAAAFHEAFGDMTAILCALQLPTLRDDVVASTTGKLDRSSRLSRVAEQLGYAIRSVRPDAVDPDCLRNAANSFFYEDPTGLPPSAPASMLSSEPHSFSRVFSGAFLRVLAGMFAAQPQSDSDALLQASHDAGRLLAYGADQAPVVPSYFSQVAAHMIEADQADFGGRYHDALKSGFVRHGVLSLDAADPPVAGPAPTRSAAGRPAGRARGRRAVAGPAAARARGAQWERPALAQIALPGEAFGLARPVLVHAASQPKRFAIAGAAKDLRSVDTHPHDHAAASFVDSLLKRGRIELPQTKAKGLAPTSPRAHKTHQLSEAEQGLVLNRLLFDCTPSPGHACHYHRT